jgi:hypothetical protein
MAGQPGADLTTLYTALADAYDRPSWHRLAACRGQDPVAWVPLARIKKDAHALRAACARCPVVFTCGTAAIAEDDHFGLRGGMTPAERRALARGRVIVLGDLSLYLDSTGQVRALDPDASTALDLSVPARLAMLARLAPAVSETAATAESVSRPARAGPLPATVDAEALRLRQAGSTWRQVAETLGLGRESSARTAAARHSARIGTASDPPRGGSVLALDLPVLARLEPLLDRLTDPAAVWPTPAPMDALSAARRRLRLPPPPPPPRAAAPALAAPAALSGLNLAAAGAPAS